MKKARFGCFLSIGILCLGLFGGFLFLAPRYGIHILPPSPQTYAESAIYKMDFALHKPENWEEDKERARAQLKSAKTYEDTYPILGDLTQLAGGKHSRFYQPNEWKTSQEAIPLPEIQKEGDFLSIRLPEFLGSEEQGKAYVKRISTALVEEDYRGIIVDLSDNGGGNLAVQLAGFAQLLGSETLFSADYGDGKLYEMSLPSISQGDFTNLAEKFPKKMDKNIPIAILVNEKTASAAEMTALALKTLPHSRIFGQKTAGYTSINQLYPLYDGAVLQLTIGRLVDKSGKIYDNSPVEPDEESKASKLAAEKWQQAQEE